MNQVLCKRESKGKYTVCVCVCASVNLVVNLELEGAAKFGADAQCECVWRGNNRWNIDIS